MFFFKSKDISKSKLSFFRQYSSSDGYSTTAKIKKESIDDTIRYFRKNTDFDRYASISIESKLNDIYYPIFDLDCQSKYELFKTLCNDIPYVIYISSYNNAPSNEDNNYHYWGIIDKPTKKIDDIFLDMNWKICNDENYVNFSIERKKLLLRGLYENKQRKPHIIDKNGTFSTKFNIFIDELENHYNNIGFELSVLRYKDPELLIKFNRKLKLKQLNKKEDEDITAKME